MDEARRLASDFAKLPALLGPEWRSSSKKKPDCMANTTVGLLSVLGGADCRWDTA